MELPSVTGIGRFRAAMALYEDGSFLTPFGLNPILQHDQTMYIGVFLLDKMTGGDNRKLVLKNCWASPSNSSNDEIKEQFLSDRIRDLNYWTIFESVGAIAIPMRFGSREMRTKESFR